MSEDEFFDTLSQARDWPWWAIEWHDEDGGIRKVIRADNLLSSTTQHCPITAAAAVKGCGNFEVGQYREAAKALDLDDSLVKAITRAAEGEYGHDPRLRSRLEEVLKPETGMSVGQLVA